MLFKLSGNGRKRMMDSGALECLLLREDAPERWAAVDGFALADWRKRVFKAAALKAELERFRPYDLRHAFVSLLLAERRSVLEVPKQAGHSPTMALTTYGHVIEELEGTGEQVPEEVIRRAVTSSFAPRSHGNEEVADC